ncbi:unnamed protein product [Cyprideis torosa]|uniref:Origin recognition complex subunit 1 n=1 Tax=Cyprideis torosa TaxID=163714 RepID=A0A7R8ZN37_9CRUS|nr:unnamed protein product [Cyprideis torosa]CAG0897067.1 unnamed protein product [Cyprideis torosa]
MSWGTFASGKVDCNLSNSMEETISKEVMLPSVAVNGNVYTVGDFVLVGPAEGDRHRETAQVARIESLYDSASSVAMARISRYPFFRDIPRSLKDSLPDDVDRCDEGKEIVLKKKGGRSICQRIRTDRFLETCSVVTLGAYDDVIEALLAASVAGGKCFVLRFSYDCDSYNPQLIPIQGPMFSPMKPLPQLGSETKKLVKEPAGKISGLLRSTTGLARGSPVEVALRKMQAERENKRIGLSTDNKIGAVEINGQKAEEEEAPLRREEQETRPRSAEKVMEVVSELPRRRRQRSVEQKEPSPPPLEEAVKPMEIEDAPPSVEPTENSSNGNKSLLERRMEEAERRKAVLSVPIPKKNRSRLPPKKESAPPTPSPSQTPTEKTKPSKAPSFEEESEEFEQDEDLRERMFQAALRKWREGFSKQVDEILDVSIKWVGESWQDEDKIIWTRYNTFKRGPLVLSVGDFALISNSEAGDPESMDGSEIVQILKLYDTGDKGSSTRRRGVIQWFTRFRDIPRAALRRLHSQPFVSGRQEVLVDKRDYGNDIDLETLIGKCLVVVTKPKVDPRIAILRHRNSPVPVFSNRFTYYPSNKIIPTAEGFFNIVKKKPKTPSPILSKPIPRKKTATDTPTTTGKRSRSGRMLRTVVEDTDQTSTADDEEDGADVSSDTSDDFIAGPKKKRELYASDVLDSDDFEEEDDDDDFLGTRTPTRTKKGKKKKNLMTSRKKAGLTPSLPKRRFDFKPKVSEDQGLVGPLPCRENEFEQILSFVEGHLQAGTGGCMYICGVPGTGKTATVKEVVKYLHQESSNLPAFQYVEINGMRLTDPKQAYSVFYKQLTGDELRPNDAADQLNQIFRSEATSVTTPRKKGRTGRASKKPSLTPLEEGKEKKKSVLLLVDEKQNILYNIFEWPTRTGSRLIILAVANTMDLPERIFMNKVTSRMGLSRLNFQPYSHQQLQEIAKSKISNFGHFKTDAIQFVSRKVAAICGDARRLTDICRRAVEISKHSKKRDEDDDVDNDTDEDDDKRNGKPKSKLTVTMSHVNAAIQEMYSQPLVRAVRKSSKLAQLFLQAMVQELERTGREMTSFDVVYPNLISLATFDGSRPPSVAQALQLVSSLASVRLILAEGNGRGVRQKLQLNMNADDVMYALGTANDNEGQAA